MATSAIGKSTAGTASTRPPAWAEPAWLMRFAFLLTAVAYVRCIGFDFIYDDFAIIVMNPTLSSWRFLPTYFMHHVWWAEMGNASTGYYRPLFLVWLRLTEELFGSAPGWFHLSAIALHAAAVWLVYRLGCELLHDAHTAAVAALLFAVSPVHIEAVAWICGASEALFAVFFLGAFLAHLHWRKGNAGWWGLAASLLYLCGFFAKETMAVFVPVVLAYEWLIGAEHGARQAVLAGRRVLPYIFATIPYAIMRVVALHGVAGPGRTLRVVTMLFTGPEVAWFYIRHSVWPMPISMFYDVDAVTRAGWTDFAFPLGLSAAVLVAGWWSTRRAPLWRFALLWFVLPLLPVLVGIAYFQKHDYVHERYLYVPSVAVCLAGAALIGRVGRDERRRWVFAAVLGFCVVLSAIANWQSRYWATELSLWAHSAEAAPHNALAREYLAEAQVSRRDPSALATYQQVVALDPKWVAGIAGMANAYYVFGRMGEARTYYRQAIEAAKDNGSTPPSGAYYYLGIMETMSGELGQAEADLRQAERLSPNTASYHFALSDVLRREGRIDEAQQEYARSLAATTAESRARPALAPSTKN